MRKYKWNRIWVLLTLFFFMAVGIIFKPSGAEDKPILVKQVSYDATAQSNYKGPEIVSGPDEPNIPGGPFKGEQYAFVESIGVFLDGARQSCAISAPRSCYGDPNLDDRFYFVDNFNSLVLVLDGDRLYKIAGSGVRGDCDGPAETAEFNFGVYHSPTGGIAIANNGDIYIADNENKKIKRIYKDENGRWMVKTIAGGGKKKLALGDSANAIEVDLRSLTGEPVLHGPKRDILSFNTAKFDQAGWSNYLLTTDGKLKCVGTKDKAIETGLETSYYYTWTVSFWAFTCNRVSYKDGAKVRIAGLSNEEIVDQKIDKNKVVDGPVNRCTFFTTFGPLRPDGRAIYTVGGDEWFIRRIMNGEVKTLNKGTGKWETYNERKQDSYFGGSGIINLGWDGYVYYSNGWRGGMFRAKLYEPIKKPN